MLNLMPGRWQRSNSKLGNATGLEHFTGLLCLIALNDICQTFEMKVADWPVSVHEPYTLRAHVAVGGQDASGRVDPLAPCRCKSIPSRHTLLGPDHILLWIFTLITQTMARCHRLTRSNTTYSHDVNLSSSCGTGPRAFCAGDASLGAPASREHPVPPRVCAPVTGNETVSLSVPSHAWGATDLRLTCSCIRSFRCVILSMSSGWLLI